MKPKGKDATFITSIQTPTHKNKSKEETLRYKI